MRIGELAERTGVSRRMLRHYEQSGLLHARRGTNGWREYVDTDIARVTLIADMISAGLTVDGVKQLEPCLDDHDPARCDDPDLPTRTYQARLIVLEQRIAHLRHQQERLTRRIQETPSGSRP